MRTDAVKKPVDQDWHPADIKAALHKKNITLAGIARAYKLNGSSSLSQTFTRSYPINERRIADAIGIHPKVIWPSRYNLDGTRKLQGFRIIQFNATVLAHNSKRHADDGKSMKVA